MIKMFTDDMFTDDKKEYFGAKEIVERLIQDIENELEGNIYRFCGIENANEEIDMLEHEFSESLSRCDDEIYYSYELDFFDYEDNKTYTFYNKRFILTDEAIENIEEDIENLLALKKFLLSD